MTSIVPTNFPSPLTGNETLRAYSVDATGRPCGEDFLCTSQQIANLANTEDSSLLNTNITTTGTTVLTGAALVGGQITRSGPTANFIDATDTAANILSALPGVIVNSSFFVRIKNATAYEMEFSAGMGVTLPKNIVIPPFSVWNGFVTVTSATAVTFQHSFTSPITPAENLLLAAAVPIVSTTALANLTGLSASLLTSGTYKFNAELPVTADAAGGVSLALAASNSLTATGFTVTGKFFTAAGIATINTTTLGGAVGSTAAVVLAELEGVINVNTGGTLTLQAAQNVSTTQTTTLLANGTFSVTRMS